MIQDYQWYWLIGLLISGIYAAYCEASKRGTIFILARNSWRFHVYISSFVAFVFLILVVLSVLKGR